MKNKTYTFQALIWLWPSEKASWHFVTLPKETGAQVRADYAKPKRGWGSIPVVVTIGKTTWKTSIFPDKKRDTYILPIKAEVRKKEDIGQDDKVDLSIRFQTGV